MQNKTGLTILALLILALIAGIALITGFVLISKTNSSAEHGNSSSASPNAVPSENHDSSGSSKTPASSSNIASHKAIDELSKSKSAEEMAKVKDFNDTVLNPNTNIESRKKAVDLLVQMEGVDSAGILLDNLVELKKPGSPDKKDDEIIGYITVTLNELYKETNKSAKKENQPVTPVNSGSEQAGSTENPALAALPDAQIPAEVSAPAPESTGLETATQKSLIEIANLKMDAAGSVDKLTSMLFDKGQSQAVKLLGLKKLVELDAKTSLLVFEELFSADSSVSDDVVMVTAIKAVYDMNTAEALSLLEKTAQSSANDHVKETIKQLTEK